MAIITFRLHGGFSLGSLSSGVVTLSMYIFLFLMYFVDVPAPTNTLSPFPEQGLRRQHSHPHMGLEPHAQQGCSSQG
jgi:hypothetical protein